MRLGKVTSAVEGVGGSRKENTQTKGWLESLLIHVRRKCILQVIFQVYVTLQTYVYKKAPMPKYRSMGAIWFKRKLSYDSEKQRKDKHLKHKGNTEGTG